MENNFDTKICYLLVPEGQDDAAQNILPVTNSTELDICSLIVVIHRAASHTPNNASPVRAYKALTVI